MAERVDDSGSEGKGGAPGIFCHNLTIAHVVTTSAKGR